MRTAVPIQTIWISALALQWRRLHGPQRSCKGSKAWSWRLRVEAVESSGAWWFGPKRTGGGIVVGVTITPIPPPEAVALYIRNGRADCDVERGVILQRLPNLVRRLSRWCRGDRSVVFQEGNLTTSK